MGSSQRVKSPAGAREALESLSNGPTQHLGNTGHEANATADPICQSEGLSGHSSILLAWSMATYL